MHKNIWNDMKADTQPDVTADVTTDITTDVRTDVTMDVVLHKKDRHFSRKTLLLILRN